MSARYYNPRVFDGRGINLVRPGHTVRGAHGDLLVAPAGMRDFLGLFSDTSQDTVLEDLSAFAQEKVGDFIGVPVRKVDVTDYFPASGPGAILELSQLEGLDTTATTTVSYQDAARAKQTIDSANWFLDSSASPWRVVLLDDAPAAGDMSDKVQNPLSVVYKTAGFDDFGEGSIKMAIMEICQALYYARGEGMPDARATDRIVAFACRSLQRGVLL